MTGETLKYEATVVSTMRRQVIVESAWEGDEVEGMKHVAADLLGCPVSDVEDGATGWKNGRHWMCFRNGTDLFVWIAAPSDTRREREHGSE